MPEIKNLFTSGRMNKDLDERLIPSNQYRDALNIQVSSSEGSDVGAIENILGNKSIINKAYNIDTQVHTKYNVQTPGFDILGLPNDAKTIGAIRFDKTECIYWFVASDTVNAVVEYNQSIDVVSPIIVDKNNVLQFSKDKLITGINIIEDLLLFTDDNSEPKCINIKRFREASAASTNGFSNHTEIYGRDFIESDVTTAKLHPTTAPTLSMYNTKQLDSNGDIATTSTRTFANLTELVDTEYQNLEIGSTLQLSWETDPLPFFNVGDTLILKAFSSEPDENDHEARVKVSNVPSTNPHTYAEVTILQIISAPQQGISWEVELDQDPPMFEFKFPRFAYRYVYEDNEVSTFSPFSEPAFIPGDFEYNPEKGFNLGVKNNLRNLQINDYSNNVPKGVSKIDIIYKEEGNQNVYIVDTITKEGDGSFKPSYAIRSEIISKVVESNQILRPWDNIPRKAKAQEIVANRIVYGNYLQNFNLKNANGEDIIPKVSINIEHDPNIITRDEFSGVYSAAKSIKTLRTYQAGVVYKDKYGRETPVFSSELSSINLPKTQADQNNRIKLTLESDPPEGFTGFKFFIKENSNEYYNLCMDRFYIENDTDNVWLSSPSSERNKVQEDTFLILKKQHANNDFVSEDARYKIIAISNEAPITIRERKESKGKITTNFTIEGFPSSEKLVLQVPKDEFDAAGGGAEGNNLIAESDLTCKIITSGQSTPKYYDISGLSLIDNGNNDYYEITLTVPLEDMDFVGTFAAPTGGVGIQIFKKSYVNKPEFQGRFFVKIYRDAALQKNIIDVGNTRDFAVNIEKNFGNKTSTGNNQSSWMDGVGGFCVDNSRVRWYREFSRGGLTPDQTPVGETLPIKGEYGRGIKQGSKYIDFCFFYWGRGNRSAMWGHWINFENFEPAMKGVVKKLEAPGTYFRFEGDPDQTVYQIEDYARMHMITYDTTGASGREGSTRLMRWTLKLDKPISWSPESVLDSKEAKTRIQFLETYAGETTFSSENPAIWETEPKENVDLNLFYEASDVIDINNHGTSLNPSTHSLDWFNCYSFGNGVESDRIRDDFNAKRIGKGVKVSATLDEPYQEERRETGLIFSQIFNSISGVNRLNQFIQALPITKDLNPAYGSIQKLHTRDTDLITLCEDKCLKILANKDALFNADGNTNITSNNNVLGQAMPFAGEYGISKNPESFASYGFRTYFSDKNRGVVLRLSIDGLEEISSQGMSDYFSDKLANESVIIGSYDDYSNCYNISFSDETVSYKQGLQGWPTRKSFVPESGVSLNNIYYTFKGSKIWSHNNEIRNNFYGIQYKSTVKLIFNVNPSKVKNFKALSYEGDSGWTTPNITTNMQNGTVLSYIPKEGMYYNFVKGIENTWDNSSQTGSLDTSEFSTQGIDILQSITGDVATTEFTLTIKENND